MAGSDWDRENPYASPRSTVEGPIHVQTEDDPDRFVIEPWLAPRGLVDFLSGLLAYVEATVLLAIVFGVSCLAAAWCTRKPEGALWGIAIVVILLFPAAIYEMLCRLRHLHVDAAGITFGRRVGKPKFLKWGEIRVIRPATRSEVLFKAWLWLWLEPTKSESTAGHYRIEWADGYLFFPPKDPARFERAIGKFCPRLLGEQ